MYIWHLIDSYEKIFVDVTIDIRVSGSSDWLNEFVDTNVQILILK